MGLAVFLDTLFRQCGRCVTNPVDTIDFIVSGCRNTRIVLLHSAGAAMLELFELGRMYEHILLDLSFSLLRYSGSSLDADMRFLLANLDQRVVIGSDFPEYTPREMLDRFESLAATLPKSKRDAVLFGNLTTLFSDCGAE